MLSLLQLPSWLSFLSGQGEQLSASRVRTPHCTFILNPFHMQLVMDTEPLTRAFNLDMDQSSSSSSLGSSQAVTLTSR